MEPTRSTAQLAASALVLGALLLAGACGGDTDDAVSSDGPASPSANGEQTSEASPTEAEGGRITLSDNFSTGATPPVWEFPVHVDKWSLEVIDQNGVNQLAKGEGLFTSFQLDQGTSGGDDAGNSEAYLDAYYEAQRDTPGVESISAADPTITTLPSDQGELEFLRQEVHYTTANGTTYRSRMLVRSLDTNVLALQYAAPEDEWTEEEWEKLTEPVRVRLGS